MQKSSSSMTLVVLSRMMMNNTYFCIIVKYISTITLRQSSNKNEFDA